MANQMQCVVEDVRIAEVVRGNDTRGSDLPISLIKALRAKLRVILAAPDNETLKNWKSLKFRQAGAGGTIQLSEEWFMRVEISSVGGDQEMKIVGLTARAGAAA